MRTCYDSITVGNLPSGAPLYLGYVDGIYKNFTAVQATFPSALVIGVAVFASTNDGDMLDVEPGNATPAEAPGWVQMRKAAGHLEPMVYTFEADRQAVIDAFTTAGVALPPLWIADYNGVAALIQATDVACQYWDFPPANPYDVSIVIDYLPGIDPAPTPPAPTQEDDMGLSAPIKFQSQQVNLFQANGDVWHKWNISGSGWQNEAIPFGNFTFPPNQSVTAEVVEAGALGNKSAFIAVYAIDSNFMVHGAVQAQGSGGWIVVELP